MEGATVLAKGTILRRAGMLAPEFLQKLRAKFTPFFLRRMPPLAHCLAQIFVDN